MWRHTNVKVSRMEGAPMAPLCFKFGAIPTIIYKVTAFWKKWHTSFFFEWPPSWKCQSNHTGFQTYPTLGPPLNRSTSCLGRKGQVAILENSAIWRHTNVNNTRVLYTGYSYHMIREFEGELSGVLMERICRQWAEWWQMTSSSFVSPLDCLTSFLGISLSRAVSSFGRITNVPKLAITAES